jgi:hypothetical protein
MKITFLDFWIASPRVSPVISDTSNLLDYWISNSQSNPQFPLFYTGSAIADSTAIGVGTLLWASTGIALADSAANGAGGLLRPLAGTGNATADSIATAVGVRGKTSPLNYWISTSQRAPVFIEVANYLDYWIFSDRSSPQISEFAISSVGTATADSTANGVGATQVIETPSGGCECNSAVSTIQIFAETPSGGCECNSAVGTIQIFAETPSGGCECNSTVDAYKVYTEIPSGGCECNSTVGTPNIFVEIPSGGCECNSTASTPNIFVEIPSGGCECNSAVESYTSYTEIPSGGCECNSSIETDVLYVVYIPYDLNNFRWEEEFNRRGLEILRREYGVEEATSWPDPNGATGIFPEEATIEKMPRFAEQDWKAVEEATVFPDPAGITGWLPENEYYSSNIETIIKFMQPLPDPLGESGQVVNDEHYPSTEFTERSNVVKRKSNQLKNVTPSPDPVGAITYLVK